jgi:hypothetical protein
MAMPGVPSIPEFSEMGVVRVSIGQCATLAAMGTRAVDGQRAA